MNSFRAFLVMATSVLCLSNRVYGQSSTCGDAYEKAQEDRVQGRLIAALAELKICVASDCPKFIRDDCSRWMDQVESGLPSVVFAVRQDGNDVTNVEVRCDGLLLTRQLDGKAVAIDPGLHTFSFDLPESKSVEHQVLIREGEHNRVVSVDFSPPGSGLPAGAASVVDPRTPRSPSNPEDDNTSVKGLTYGLAGLGALGVVGFTAFALWGESQQKDLERTCSPTCESNRVDGVKTKYIAADACLGVGLIALGVATYLFLTRHDAAVSTQARNDGSLTFFPRASGQGGGVGLSAPF